MNPDLIWQMTNIAALMIMICVLIGIFLFLIVLIIRMYDYAITKIGAYIGLLAYIKEHYGDIRKWVRERQSKKSRRIWEFPKRWLKR